jgi:hypothetical protein
MSSKGTLSTGATGRTTPANFRTTRSNTKATTQQPSVSPQAATLEKKKAKVQDLETEARRLLISEECLSDGANITHHTITHSLSLLTQRYRQTAPQNLTRALTALVALSQQTNNNATAQLTPIVDKLSHELGGRIEKTMQEELDKMSNLIKSSMAEQCKATKPPADLAEAVSTLKQVATEMNKTVGEASAATTQINDTALNYKQALLSATNQAPQLQPAGTPTDTRAADPELTLGIDKKVRQILLDSTKGEDNHMNIYEIKEKVATALADIVPPPPQGAEVQEVIKLRNGSTILQFASKEVADWLCIPINEAAFTRRFDPDTIIRDRVHPIMVPRIPLTFDPSNPAHLREVEEVNRMGPKMIKKARWIKPEYRHAPEQSCAHAIFTISSVTDANRMIKDGIYVCNARSFPKKLKYEPKQCMKCRKWGHYAAECRAQSDTCGTCSGQHKTNECKTNNKKYCVSCRTDTHTSWDRNCPEFLRKCDEYSKFHPENNLVYFPTDENWTTTSRPALIPFEERFPTRYTVGSLPMPNRAEQQLPTRPIGKRNKRSNNNNDSSQAVLEKFFNKMIDEQPDQLDAPPPRADDDDDDDYYNTQIVSVQNTLPADFLQNHKA